MLSRTKEVTIRLFQERGMEAPDFVQNAPDDARFASGWTPSGHVPLYRVGELPPTPASGVVSIDPSFGLSEQ